MRVRVWIAFSTLATIAAISGCSQSTSKPEAEAALAVFHERFNAGDTEKIWGEAREEFQTSTQRDQLTAMLATVRHKLGKVVSTRNLNWQMNSRNFTTTVVLVQETQYEHGTGSETFTFVVEDHKAQLLQFSINSPALLSETPGNDIEGTWIFEKEVDTRADGTVVEVLKTPYVGSITYTRDGHVAATVMPAGRKWKANTATREELHESVGVGAATAYAGRYEIDAANKTVVHIPLVSIDPADIDTRLVRHYVVEGDHLQLSGKWTEQGEELTFTVHWKRAPDETPK